MLWLRRWNFIERAKLERQLWEAFERGDDLEALVERCRLEAEGTDLASADPVAAFRLEVWQTTLKRIRKIEMMMRGKERKG